MHSWVKIPFIASYRFIVANIPSPHHVAGRAGEARNETLHLDAGVKANGTPGADSTQSCAGARTSTG
jgi:hypothetical protein